MMSAGPIDFDGDGASASRKKTFASRQPPCEKKRVARAGAGDGSEDASGSVRSASRRRAADGLDDTASMTIAFVAIDEAEAARIVGAFERAPHGRWRR